LEEITQDTEEITIAIIWSVFHKLIN
jgi:hypothetical protein